jgi:hypothetical protein
MFESISGITRWSHTSFDKRLSERKKPSGSEKSELSFQNSGSDSWDGSESAACGREIANALMQKRTVAVARSRRLVVGVVIRRTSADES